MQEIQQAISVVNFDLDYISPSCLFTWTYYRSYALTVLLPIVTAAIMAFRHFILHHNQDRCIASFLSFLVIVYNGLCIKVFGTFLCEVMIDGSQMLHADPSVTCWEQCHIKKTLAIVQLNWHFNLCTKKAKTFMQSGLVARKFSSHKN